MGNFSDLSRLSFTLEIMGLVLAWGETRRPFWFVRFEQALDAVSEASFGDVVSLLPALLEYVVVVFLIGAYLYLVKVFNLSNLNIFMEELYFWFCSRRFL